VDEVHGFSQYYKELKMTALNPPTLIPGANPRLSKEFLHTSHEGIALVGQRCVHCKTVLFPKTGICPSCQSEDLSDEVLPRQGVLYSWSVVHAAPKPWVTPYVIGYVDLPENVRVFTHIGGDPEQLRIDMPVALEAADVGFTKEGTPRPFFQFVPATA
jgi:uncharacterized OB-fold protein